MSDEANPSWWRRLAWFTCGALILLLLPVLKYAELWGSLQRAQKFALLIVLAAFAAACLLAMIGDRSASWLTARRSLVRSFAILSLFVIAAALLSISLPRYLLLPLVVVSASIIPLSASPAARWPWPLGVLVAFTGVLTAYALTGVDFSPQIERSTRDVYFSTAFYPLQATMREGWIPEPATRGVGPLRGTHGVLS